METPNIRYARAKNFLCFSEKEIELNFDQYDKIVLIKGVNKDTGTDEHPASNGSGKSSIPEILSYGIYGKTIKKTKQVSNDKVINTKSGKGLEIEIIFGDYRILRKRSPNSLRLWKSSSQDWTEDNEITRGTMKDTQETIESAIGLTHHAFCNVVVFDDSRSYAFLESDTPTKRITIENLLHLDRYRNYNEVAKSIQKESKNNLNTSIKDYENIQLEIDNCTNRIEKIELQEKNWLLVKNNELNQLKSNIKQYENLLNNLDMQGELEKYNKAQNRIIELQNLIKESETKKNNVDDLLKQASKKVDDFKNQKDQINEKMQQNNLLIKESESAANKSQKLVDNLNNLAIGTKCPVCHGLIDQENFQSVVNHECKLIETNSSKLKEFKSLVLKDLSNYKELQSNISKLEDMIDKSKTKVKEYNKLIELNIQEMNNLAKTPKPNMDTQQQVLESQINDLKNQISSKENELNGKSPYKDIIESAILEKEEKIKEKEVRISKLKLAEDELPYYDFWVTAFGDKGIRKFVVDGIIPALNSQVAYWMQHLYDGIMELKFDNELSEEITRNGNKAYYFLLSNGEQQRINLAVSQSFAYIMSLSSGSCPSLVFLDEITGGSIDKSGVSGVFNTICELSKERQVFITTHNEYLLNMLEGYEEIVLIKENDVTTIA